LLLGDWVRALFIHYEVEPAALQRQVPFALDLREGEAWVSLVAFSMRRLRPRAGGKVAEWLFRPLSNHEFLNVRTYVRPRGEPGIYFIAEWLNNRACTLLGPLSYGLPYRFGKIAYAHRHEQGILTGTVQGGAGADRLSYAGRLPADPRFAPCEPGSLDEFLLERYSAYTCHRGATRRFDIWHKPWPQVPLEMALHEDKLLHQTGPWFQSARRACANYSTGAKDIWIGPPRHWPDGK
jgi:uncharacterized protein YqjF (DUF2071 family)